MNFGQLCDFVWNWTKFTRLNWSGSKNNSKQTIIAYNVITFLVPKILPFLILDLQNSNQRDYALSAHNYERRRSLRARKGTWSDHQENVKVYPLWQVTDLVIRRPSPLQNDVSHKFSSTSRENFFWKSGAFKKPTRAELTAFTVDVP